MEIEERLLYPPVGRAAYSDRMAWIMAEMSKLAYEAFEADATREKIIKELAELTDIEEIGKRLEEYKDKLLGLDTDGQNKLKDRLAVFKFELVKTFDNNGTQAFLAKRDIDKLAVLAFRGTEKDVRDIKTDLKARFYRSTNGVKIHNGFYLAFKDVQAPVLESLEGLKDYTVYITGHSLGGALALIAARYLYSDNVGACYTFGSPKVGNIEFGDEIKIPIYRIVNSADIVPRLPPSWFFEFLSLLAKLVPIPFLRSWLINFVDSLKGYTHQGDMRYLTDCGPDFKDLKVISNIDFLARFSRFFKRLSKDFKSAATDHFIYNYSQKLRFYALNRLNSSL
jgi:hypothetical protein